MYRLNTEEYYQKFLDLQEKLRRSEEERIKLEIKLNKMMQVVQNEEQRHYDKISIQYKQFWEEDKRRQDRNNYILRILDRVENQSAALEEKARRFSLIKHPISTTTGSYYRRNLDDPKIHIPIPSYSVPPESTSRLSEHDLCLPTWDYEDVYTNRNLRLQHQEKMHSLNKFLDSLNSGEKAKKPTEMFLERPSHDLPSQFDVKAPSVVEPSVRTEGMSPTRDFGYKVENFLTKRYSPQKYDDDDDYEYQIPESVTPRKSLSREKSPSATPIRSTTPNETKFYESSESDSETGNLPAQHYSPRYEPPKITRNLDKVQKPVMSARKPYSSDYKKSLRKLRRIQNNSRKILQQNEAKKEFGRVSSPQRFGNEDRKSMHDNFNKINQRYHDISELRPAPVIDRSNATYPVYPSGLNDLYQPEYVIQKYLDEKYKNYLTEKYLYNPYEFICRDRVQYETPRFYSNRNDYTSPYPGYYHRNMGYNNHIYDQYKNIEAESNMNTLKKCGNVDLNPTSSSRSSKFGSYDGLNTLDNSKLAPKETILKNYGSNEEIRPTKLSNGSVERKPGIHFNDNDQVLEYDRNGPLTSYSKNVNSAQISPEHNKTDKEKVLKNPDQDYHTDYKISENVNGRAEDAYNEKDLKDEPKLYKEPTNPNTVKITENDKTDDIYIPNDSNVNNGIESIKEVINQKPIEINESTDGKLNENGVIEDYKVVKDKIVVEDNSIVPNPQDIVQEKPVVISNTLNSVSNVDQAKDDLKNNDMAPQIDNIKLEEVTSDKIISEPVTNKDDKVIENNSEKTEIQPEQTNVQNEENAQPIQYDENGQAVQYDANGQPIQSYAENGQPIQYDANGQPIQYDANGQAIQYDANSQAIPYDANAQQIQYDENGQPIQYDANGQPIQYDANGQPIQYDANGQPIQYDEQGQPIQYDANGQPIQYDENGQPIQYDANGQAIPYDANTQQIQYDENGQPIQYDANGQPIQYDENGQAIQYDENGQPIQYDANGQAIQYDANGQPIQYDENGQQIQYDANGQPIQYDENGQPIQYDENGQLIQYDANGQQIFYDENGQAIQYDENGQPIQYDANGQLIQYDANGQAIQYDESGQPIQYDENGQVITAVSNEPAVEESAKVEADAPQGKNVLDMLDTDTESIKQDTKVSNDSDFDITTTS